jgi:cytochrome d ubiquinol oxidase subunit II
VGWANIVHGVPMDSRHNVTASLLDLLLNPYALLGGLVTLSLFLGHGAMFLTLRTPEEMAARARAIAARVSLVSVVLLAGFLIWTASDQTTGGTKVSADVLAAGSVALAAAVPLLLSGRAATGGHDGWAFALSAGAIALLFTSLFVDLFPLALPSTTSAAYDLTLVTASSSHYAQTVMTVVAVICLPIVLAYQAWTYWVFRHRLGRDDFEGTPTPMAVLSQLPGIGVGAGDARPAPAHPSPAGGDGSGGRRPGPPGSPDPPGHT